MFGLFPLTMIECKYCMYARSLEHDELSILIDFNSLKHTTTCRSCGVEFSYLDGITQDIISENTFSEYAFVSDIHLSNLEEIVVGKWHRVELPFEVYEFQKIFVTCNNGFADVVGIRESVNSIRILSSEVPNGIPCGEILKVAWSLYGRSKDLNIPTWRALVVQSKEQLIAGKNNIALLTSEMAFESYLNNILVFILVRSGLSTEAASVIVDSINSISNKVHKLLPTISVIKLKDNKTLNNSWQEVVRLRNKIAHGETISISNTQAREAFKTIIGLILYFEEHLESFSRVSPDSI